MRKQPVITWFLRGFTLTLLLVLAFLAATQAPTVLAQIGEGNTGGQTNESANPPASDNPAGTAASQGQPAEFTFTSNLDAQPDFPAQSGAPATDDPLGRTNITPLTYDRSVTNDQAYSPEIDDSVSVDGQPLDGGAHPEAYGSPWLIPGGAFRDDGFYPGNMFFSFSGGYIRGDEPDPGSSCVQAPVYLPFGATVTDFWASVMDNSAANDWWGYLYRVDNYSGVVDTMATLSTTGADTNIDNPGDSTITFPVVDSTHSYYIGSCLYDTNIHLFGQRAYYTP